MDKFVKQEGEKFPIVFDFSDVLEPDEVIDALESEVYVIDVDTRINATGDIIDPGSLIVSDKQIQVRVQDGVAGKKYIIIAICNTSERNAYLKVVQMVVREPL